MPLTRSAPTQLRATVSCQSKVSLPAQLPSFHPSPSPPPLQLHSRSPWNDNSALPNGAYARGQGGPSQFQTGTSMGALDVKAFLGSFALMVGILFFYHSGMLGGGQEGQSAAHGRGASRRKVRSMATRLPLEPDDAEYAAEYAEEPEEAPRPVLLLFPTLWKDLCQRAREALRRRMNSNVPAPRRVRRAGALSTERRPARPARCSAERGGYAYEAAERGAYQAASEHLAFSRTGGGGCGSNGGDSTGQSILILGGSESGTRGPSVAGAGSEAGAQSDILVLNSEAGAWSCAGSDAGQSSVLVLRDLSEAG
jgi:hypothetical protein